MPGKFRKMVDGKTTYEPESSTGLRAVARNLLAMAAHLGDTPSSLRMRSIAHRYLLLSENLEKGSAASEAPAAAPNGPNADLLRARAREIFALAAKNPEKQWQRTKLLANQYLREADKLDAAEKVGNPQFDVLIRL